MAGRGRAKTAPSRIEAEERQAAALNLRKAGVSFEEIARQTGYASASGAYEAVKAAMAKTLREPANELRELELARLDGMLEAISEAVMAGDLNAIGMALRISERRSRILGLDYRERPLSIKLPKLESAQDIPTVAGAILAGVAEGNLLPGEAARIAELLQVVERLAFSDVLVVGAPDETDSEPDEKESD